MVRVTLGSNQESDFNYRIDSSIAQDAPAPLDENGQWKIVGTVLAPDGGTGTFISNEVIVHAPDHEILNRLVSTYDGTVVVGGELPDPPASVSPDRVRPEATDVSSLAPCR